MKKKKAIQGVDDGEGGGEGAPRDGEMGEEWSSLALPLVYLPVLIRFARRASSPHSAKV